jgi:hypothetical protein
VDDFAGARIDGIGRLDSAPLSAGNARNQIPYSIRRSGFAISEPRALVAWPAERPMELIMICKYCGQPTATDPEGWAERNAPAAAENGGAA